MSTIKRRWTKKEEKLFKKYYPISTVNELLKLFPGRTPLAFESKAYQLRLKKSPLFYKKDQKVRGDEMKEKKEMIDMEKFGKEMIEQLKRTPKLVKTPPNRKIFKGKIEEKAMLILSDIHGGKKNSFLDINTGKSVETYNKNICIEEANNLVGSIKEINYLISTHYDIKELYIVCVGDLVDNDIIYSGQRFFIEVGVGEQIIFVLKLLIDLITEFLNMYEKVHFIIVGGNHGRITSKKEEAPFYNNFDRLIGEFLKIVFDKNKRVEIVVPESWFYLFKVYDWKYFIHHGDDVYTWLGLPYYGITRKAKSRRGEINFDIEIIGHFHTSMIIPIGSNARTLVNGCWIKDDDWAFKKFGVRSVPTQWYFGISPKRPITWSFSLELYKR